MKVNNKHYRTVWFKDNIVFLINQNRLPFNFEIYQAKSYLETCEAIKSMKVRGAPAIGTAAAFAMAQAFIESKKINFLSYINKAKKDIKDTRPTAYNLFYAINKVYDNALSNSDPKKAAIEEAQKIADEDVENCKKIGEYGNKIIKDKFVIETHCNAGWLACTDYGTALSPIYIAHRDNKDIFVYVDETRPRSQGAKLTAWELKNENVPYCIIADNAGAYVMSQKHVDMILVGADRIAMNGDVANKIGTLEKAIVAKELEIPFYVAAPTSTFDLKCTSGKEIPIEHRNKNEFLYQTGITKENALEEILVYPKDFKVFNPAFDVTPAKYITGIITEKGIIKADELDIKKLFL